MILTTGEALPDKQINEVLGLVKGSSIRTRHIGRDLQAVLRDIVGGEVRPYVEMMNSTRDDATRRMTDEAEALEADAVIAIRHTTSTVMHGAAEVFVYGTGVKT